MELCPTGLDLLARELSVQKERVGSAHIIIVDATLQVAFELLSVHKVCQSGSELGVFDTTRFQFEPEVRVHRDEKTIQPSMMDGHRVLQYKK